MGWAWNKKSEEEFGQHVWVLELLWPAMLSCNSPMCYPAGCSFCTMASCPAAGPGPPILRLKKKSVIFTGMLTSLFLHQECVNESLNLCYGTKQPHLLPPQKSLACRASSSLGKKKQPRKQTTVFCGQASSFFIPSSTFITFHFSFP